MYASFRLWLALLAWSVTLAQPVLAVAQEEPSVSVSKKRKKKPKRVRPSPPNGVRIETRASASGGAMRGLRERSFDFAFVRGSLGVEPILRVDDLELRTPVAIVHRQTFGVSLSETRVSAVAEARYRFARALRASVFVGVSLIERPDWPDLRQPVGNDLLPTDRYSYGARRAGFGVTVHPARRHWIRASYEYRLLDYVTDPAFQALAHPTHLAPFDHEKHSAELDYHYSTRGLRVGVGATGFVKNAFFWFSRDAGSGFTHASPNGRPANPLQELRRMVPRIDLKLEPLRDQLEVVVRYAHELQEDPFQGYYSFAGPNPSVTLRARPWKPLWLHATAELWWRKYGSGSYRAGIGHPQLDDGDRRYDHRLGVELGANLALASRLALTFGASYLTRRTNFPDYAPGVFPPTRNYTVDWDYQNVRIEAGIQGDVDWL